MSAVGRQVIDLVVAGWFNYRQEMRRWTVVGPSSCLYCLENIF